MKNLFLVEDKNRIDYVYPKHILEALNYSKAYTKEEYINEGNYNVEFIFSTWSMPQFTKQEIADYFPNLKAVFYAAGTVQFFAKPFIEKGIKVFSAWAANAVPVAEYTVAQIILANKGFFNSCYFNIQGLRDKAKKISDLYSGNYQSKIGIIGVGMIGSMVAERLKGYKNEVLAFDPFLSEQKATKLNLKLCSLEDIFSNCDVISNHLANNRQTKGMLNESLFSLIKENATFINTGRGAQVVEADLIKAMKQKPNACAILDVTDPEPPVTNSEFYNLPNVFLTPHIAGSKNNEVKRMAEYMFDEYTQFINDKPTKYEVTKKMLETMA